MTFTFKTEFADYDDCYFKIIGRRCHVMSEKEGPIMTINISNPDLKFPEEMAIKTYSENKGVIEALNGIGFLGDKIGTMHLNYTDVPIHRINLDVLEKYRW